MCTHGKVKHTWVFTFPDPHQLVGRCVLVWNLSIELWIKFSLTTLEVRRQSFTSHSQIKYWASTVGIGMHIFLKNMLFIINIYPSCISNYRHDVIHAGWDSLWQCWLWGAVLLYLTNCSSSICSSVHFFATILLNSSFWNTIPKEKLISDKQLNPPCLMILSGSQQRLIASSCDSIHIWHVLLTRRLNYY